MIDLEKEREAFETNWLSLGGKLDNFEYTTDQMYSLSKEASKKLSEQDKLISIMIINQSWSYWLNFARAKQAEITELKQKLARYENPDYVLVQKSEFHTWYFDEYEGLWLDRDGIDGKLSQIDAGQVVEVRKQKQYSIEMPSVFVTLPWLDEDFDYWQEYATKEEAEKVAKHCKQMFEAVEKGNE